MTGRVNRELLAEYRRRRMACERGAEAHESFATAPERDKLECGHVGLYQKAPAKKLKGGAPRLRIRGSLAQAEVLQWLSVLKCQFCLGVLRFPMHASP